MPTLFPCAILENAGPRAAGSPPRDCAHRVFGVGSWSIALSGQSTSARVLVLIFSAHANISNQIHREVERAGLARSIPDFSIADRGRSAKPIHVEYFSWCYPFARRVLIRPHRWRNIFSGFPTAVRSYLDVEHTNGNETVSAHAQARCGAHRFVIASLGCPRGAPVGRLRLPFAF